LTSDMCTLKTGTRTASLSRAEAEFALNLVFLCQSSLRRLKHRDALWPSMRQKLHVGLLAVFS
jgi:hypothetical protein